MTAARLKQQLATHGRRRAKAREQAAAEMAEIKRLAPLAIEAGVPKRQIAELAQVTRPALDTLLSD